MLKLAIALFLSAAATARAGIPETLREPAFDRNNYYNLLMENLKNTEPAVPPPAPSPRTAPGFCVFNSLSGAPVGGPAAFQTLIQNSDAVFVGETHDQMADHLAQLEALKALYAARGGGIVVGFEMLNMTLQPVLDDYAAGRLTEEDFLLKADWKTEWGFDFNLYKPLFDFIRANRLKALALNLPKKVVSNIAHVGLEALTPEDKQYLPPDLKVTTNEAYIKYIRSSFEGHMADMFKFENYLAAMSAWNETMGARLAAFVNANPGFAALAVAGAGHVIYNAGIPESFKSRTAGLRLASFYPQDAAACPAAFPAQDAGLADYVWYLDHSPAQER
ncbi:MAG: ChaN family lipoprotein [Elusimicrobia bacterium]|nr:ChaN family lipoprotein [Elusimicrobiota bacterium]